MSWQTNGIVVNPADAQILADTGSIPTGGALECTAILTTTVGCAVKVQHRNAANDTTIHEQAIIITLNSTVVVPLGQVPLAPNERVRIIQFNAAVGQVQASLVTG